MCPDVEAYCHDLSLPGHTCFPRRETSDQTEIVKGSCGAWGPLCSGVMCPRSDPCNFRAAWVVRVTQWGPLHLAGRGSFRLLVFHIYVHPVPWPEGVESRVSGCTQHLVTIFLKEVYLFIFHCEIYLLIFDCAGSSLLCRLSLVAGRRGCSLLWGVGFPLRWLLLLGAGALGSWAQWLLFAGFRTWAQQLWRTGLVDLWHVGSSQTRA